MCQAKAPNLVPEARQHLRYHDRTHRVVYHSTSNVGHPREFLLTYAGAALLEPTGLCPCSLSLFPPHIAGPSVSVMFPSFLSLLLACRDPMPNMHRPPELPVSRDRPVHQQSMMERHLLKELFPDFASHRNDDCPLGIYPSPLLTTHLLRHNSCVHAIPYQEDVITLDICNVGNAMLHPDHSPSVAVCRQR